MECVLAGKDCWDGDVELRRVTNSKEFVESIENAKKGEKIFFDEVPTTNKRRLRNVEFKSILTMLRWADKEQTKEIKLAAFERLEVIEDEKKVH